MAKIKETMTVSLEEFGKKAGEYALDEFEYKGLTIRQWADKIASGEYQSVKRGQWILHTEQIVDVDIKLPTECSECGFEEFSAEKYNFCPNCGSKNRMDGDSDD